MPIDEDERRRVELTVSCRDTDQIPKVPGAGGVVDGVQLMHNGVRVVAGGYYGEWMGEIIERLGGHHEPQEETAFHAVVERLAATNQAPIVMELGAFWSYYTLWALERMPGAQAFLVEPDPANLEVGKRNFALNGRSGTFHQAAIGALPAPPSPFRCESDGVEREVPTESLASLLDRFDVERVDLLLVDAQGAELPLLEGARTLLADGKVRFALVSTHHHTISGDPLTHQRCLAILREAGAHVVVEHTVAESFSGDGLIAAAFDDADADLHVDVGLARAGDSLFGDPVVELAAAQAELRSLRAERDELRHQVAAVSAELAQHRDASRRATDALADSQAELQAIEGTITWRARQRLLPFTLPLRRAMVARPATNGRGART